MRAAARAARSRRLREPSSSPPPERGRSIAGAKRGQRVGVFLRQDRPTYPPPDSSLRSEPPSPPLRGGREKSPLPHRMNRTIILFMPLPYRSVLDAPTIRRVRVTPDRPDELPQRAPRTRRPHGEAQVAAVRRLIEQTELTYGEIERRPVSVEPQSAAGPSTTNGCGRCSRRAPPTECRGRAPQRG